MFENAESRRETESLPEKARTMAGCHMHIMLRCACFKVVCPKKKRARGNRHEAVTESCAADERRLLHSQPHDTHTPLSRHVPANISRKQKCLSHTHTTPTHTHHSTTKYTQNMSSFSSQQQSHVHTCQCLSRFCPIPCLIVLHPCPTLTTTSTLSTHP